MTQTNHYNDRLLIAGLLMLVIGLVQMRTVFTFKFSVTPIKGVVTSVKTYVSTVTSKGRFGYESRSQKSELIFYMRGKNKQFQLTRNIGDKFTDETYQSMRHDLERADSATVWVRKSELDEFKPQVFQIAVDGEIILPHEIVRTENSILAFFLTFLGLGCLLLFGLVRFPNAARRLLGADGPATNSAP